MTRWLGAQRIDLVECGSTNDEAARLARAGARHGTIVIAEAQRAGRGREGRVWASPRGLGLYLSAVVRPPLPLALVPPMTLAIGVGVCDAARAFGAAAELKWPNDVLVGGKKLAGVLVESQSQGTRLDAVIVGIGVNLGGELPADVATTAITLADAAGAVATSSTACSPGRALALQTIDRESFIAALLHHVELWVDRYIAGGLPAVSAAWQARMAPNLIARAQPEDGLGAAMVGELAGLDGDGALLLRDAAGQLHRVRSGSVDLAPRGA